MRVFAWVLFLCKASTASSKKGPAWAESTRLRLPLELLKQSLNLEKSITHELPKSNSKLSACSGLCAEVSSYGIIKNKIKILAKIC